MPKQTMTIHGVEYRFNKIVSTEDTPSEASDKMELYRAKLSRIVQADRAYATYKINGKWCGCEYIVVD